MASTKSYAPSVGKEWSSDLVVDNGTVPSTVPSTVPDVKEQKSKPDTYRPIKIDFKNGNQYFQGPLVSVTQKVRDGMTEKPTGLMNGKICSNTRGDLASFSTHPVEAIEAFNRVYNTHLDTSTGKGMCFLVFPSNSTVQSIMHLAEQLTEFSKTWVYTEPTEPVTSAVKRSYQQPQPQESAFPPLTQGSKKSSGTTTDKAGGAWKGSASASASTSTSTRVFTPFEVYDNAKDESAKLAKEIDELTKKLAELTKLSEEVEASLPVLQKNARRFEREQAFLKKQETERQAFLEAQEAEN